MKFTYCPDCGDKLVPKTLGDEGDVPFCESCNRVRLTCTGELYMCLGQEDRADLRRSRAALDAAARTAARAAL